LLGTGWDETGWPEGRGLTRHNLDAVVGERPAYLARVDVHSATVSTALLDRIPGITALPGFSADGQLRLDAHHAVRQAAYGSVPGGLDVVRELGLAGAGGDLFCDGAFGSHTAALSAPYADRPDSSGALRFETGSLVEHLRACTEASIQAGFHVIGDAAVDQVL